MHFIFGRIGLRMMRVTLIVHDSRNLMGWQACRNSPGSCLGCIHCCDVPVLALVFQICTQPPKIACCLISN